MINNVGSVSGLQQSDSVIHIDVSILFQILFLFTLLQSIEQSSLCYTVGPCWLSILKIAACTRQSQTQLRDYCAILLHEFSLYHPCERKKGTGCL